MSKSQLTISDLIVKGPSPKLGYTPPKIFKQRAELINLIAKASMALNEHMKVTDDPVFLCSRNFTVLAAIKEVRERLEYDLACHTNNLIYYDQEEWSAGGYDCDSIISNTHDEWDKRSELPVSCVKTAKAKAAK